MEKFGISEAFGFVKIRIDTFILWTSLYLVFEEFINNPLASACALRGAQSVTALLAGSVELLCWDLWDRALNSNQGLHTHISHTQGCLCQQKDLNLIMGYS